MIFLLEFYDISMGLLWDVYYGFPWWFLGISIGFHKDFYRMPVGFLLDFHDISMEFLWHVYGIPTGFLW